ncbi:hypothetical protein EJ02DRAFT_426484 [Clathrospora elynae]|uniref:Uncharacterized protein n=1 Tax=Clathrospora elynae TaxID=706981 RepID=A0A6A5SAG3_9PLEO|nr:hypothetical protein EJ02DRAFT_426484 [Clathrospora elynae]
MEEIRADADIAKSSSPCSPDPRGETLGCSISSGSDRDSDHDPIENGSQQDTSKRANRYNDVSAAHASPDVRKFFKLSGGSELPVKVDPGGRLSARECHAKASKVLAGSMPTHGSEVDPGTPTEAMSSSVTMRALQGNTRGERTVDSIDFPSLETIIQAPAMFNEDWEFEEISWRQHSTASQFKRVAEEKVEDHGLSM